MLASTWAWRLVAQVPARHGLRGFPPRGQTDCPPAVAESRSAEFQLELPPHGSDDDETLGAKCSPGRRLLSRRAFGADLGGEIEVGVSPGSHRRRCRPVRRPLSSSRPRQRRPLFLPAAVLPVSVTPWMRRSAISAEHLAAADPARSGKARTSGAHRLRERPLDRQGAARRHWRRASGRGCCRPSARERRRGTPAKRGNSTA